MGKVLDLPKLSKELSLKGVGRVRIKKSFPEKIIYKIFETNSSFHVKYPNTGKV